jgi:hypothetical protein
MNRHVGVHPPVGEPTHDAVCLSWWKRSWQTAGRRSSRARGVLELRSLPKALPPSLGAVEGSRLPRPRTRVSSRSLPVSPPVGDSLRGWGGPRLGSESGWARNPSTPRLATLLPGTGPRRPLAAHEPVGTCAICRPYGRLALANGLNRPLIYLRSRFRFPAPPLFHIVTSRGCKEKEK